MQGIFKFIGTSTEIDVDDLKLQNQHGRKVNNIKRKLWITCNTFGNKYFYRYVISVPHVVMDYEVIPVGVVRVH